MTEPLTSADCDLRDFPYMPLDVVRLRDSETAVIASSDEFRAAVILWCAAWHQVPAASLPNNDQMLASLAGYGRDIKGWKRVREGAMRGFIQCSDGRFYHPVIAEKANEAWGRKWDRPDKSEERSEHARKAALARWGKSQSNAECDAQSVPEHGCEHIPEQCSTDALKGEERRGEEGNRKKTRSSADEPEGFQVWYDAYPRHEDRGHALKAYRSALKKTDVATLLAGAQRAHERYAGTEKRFIPLPATWLNGERWQDENDTKSAQSSMDDVCPPEIYRGLQ